MRHRRRDPLPKVPRSGRLVRHSAQPAAPTSRSDFVPRRLASRRDALVSPQPRSASASARLRARARSARQCVRERRRPALPAHLPAQRARDLVRARRPRGRGPVGGGARERFPRRSAVRPRRPEARAARIARGDDSRVRAHADDPDGLGGVRDLHALGHRQRSVLAVSVGAPRRTDAVRATSARVRAAETRDERRRRGRRPRRRPDRIGRESTDVHRPLRDQLRHVRRLHGRPRLGPRQRCTKGDWAAAGARCCATGSSRATPSSTPRS